MSATKVLGVSLVCLVLYIAAVDADCGTLSKIKLGACVATYSTANVLNLSERKRRINAGNTACPTEILKDSCTSYHAMKGCVELGGFPTGCEAAYDKKISEQDIMCTNSELYNLCGGATALMTSFTLLITCLITIFNL
ncbi:uncharacterized protein LOC124150019 [Haliotis rufescens]|uniref:uncharacterized protein LOC124150019 n=1 Tax=Haliotis rufescens TaxID=6454 RepID=UPI00201F4640|nr:uncharacterized protein LOC124150019 [Haliotis rufescens]